MVIRLFVRKASRSTATGALILMAAQGIYLLLGFLIQVILGRCYGAVNYGLYGIVMSILIWVELAVNSGVPEAMPKLISDRIGNSDLLIVSGIKLTTIIGLAGTFTLAMLAWPISSVFRDSEIARLLIFSSPDIFFYSIYALFQGVLSGRRQFSCKGLMIILYISCKFILYSLAALFGMDLIWLFIANCLSSILGLICLWKIVRPDIGLWKSSHIDVGIMKFSSSIALYWLCFYLFLNMDLWFVKGLIKDESLLGCYVAASVIAKLPLYLFTTLNGMALPLIAGAHATDNLGSMVKYTVNILSVGLVLGGTMTLVASINAEFFVKILFGETYFFAGELLSILVWGVFLAGISSFLSSWLIAIDWKNIAVILSIAVIFLDLPLLYFLIINFSIKGAAISVICGAAVSCSFGVFFLRNSPPFRKAMEVTKKVFCGFIVAIFAYLLMPEWCFSSHILCRAIANVILIGIFIGLCVFLRVFCLEDMLSVRKLVFGAADDI